MKVKFKERTFEKFFDYEMSVRAGGAPYSPDPVEEYYLGFDSGFALPTSDILWLRLLRPRFSRYRPMLDFFTVLAALEGAFMGRGFTLSMLNDLPDRVSLPSSNYMMNLFFQYKRPDYLSRSNAAEWHLHDEKPYFRYDLPVGKTDPMHQHKALVNLKNKAKNTAEVFYASPAFHTTKELLDYGKANAIIDNTNLASVEEIESHHRRISYASAKGEISKHSKVETSSTDRLRGVIDFVRDRRDNVDEENRRRALGEVSRRPYNQHIKRTAQDIHASLFEEGEEGKNQYAVERFTSVRSVLLATLGEDNLEAFEFNSQDFAHALVTIVAFCETFHLDMHM